MKVTDCPLLIVGFDGLIVGVDRTGLIVTSLFTEFVVTILLDDIVFAPVESAKKALNVQAP